MTGAAGFHRWAVLAALAAGLVLAVRPASAEERVSFPSFEDRIPGQAPTTVEGYLFRPEAAGPHPALVLLHGCRGLAAGGAGSGAGGRVRTFYAEWARRLAALGYLVLAVDSYTPRGAGEACEWWLPAGAPWVERPHDAYGALLYLQARPDVRPDRIGLVGWASGGGATLSAVYVFSQARPRRLPLGDFRAAVAVDPTACDQRLPFWRTTIPLLVLEGGSRRWLPSDHCRDALDEGIARGAPIELIADARADPVSQAAAGPHADGPTFASMRAFLAVHLEK